MSRYTDEDRERVRDAVDMVSLVESRTPLRRAGSNSFFGCCPFHDERTASFHVRPLEKHYHCFGCQASGDPFRFVMETEGLSFPEAIESLAERFGVRIEPVEDDPQAVERRKRRERLLQLLDRTASFYERVLKDSKEAQPAARLLADRGLTAETVAAFRVGYSPSAWDKVLLASREAGFTEEELLAAGLVRKAREGEQLFDRFRGRIMFPLADSRGRTIGFGARSMRDGQGPNYLNSSEGEIYHKGGQLYGLHLARAEAAKVGFTILVEGYVDALAIHQAGMSNVVASMGTALTDEQAAVLERTAPKLVLALDADRAGQAAMIKIGDVVANRKLELRVVPMPPGKDPGDLLLEVGPERLKAMVAASEPFLSFRVRNVLETAELGSAEGKDVALQALRPIIAPQAPSVLKQELIQRIATELDLAEDLVSSIVEQPLAPGEQRQAAPSAPAPVSSVPVGERIDTARGPASRLAQVERGFLVISAANPEQAAHALAAMDIEEWFSGTVERAAALRLRDHPDDPISGLDPEKDAELTSLLAGVLSRAATMEASKASFELEHAQMDLRRHDRLIERARREDPASASDLAASRELIKRRIDRAADAVEDELDARWT